uniref:Protein FAM33A n=2 Tax=Panthera TaxID=9688 RepID=A0A8C8YCQ6_PANLE
MEVEVNKLELMFLKADSDLDYFRYRLEYEIKTNHPDTASKKNPVTLLKELSKTAAEQLKSFTSHLRRSGLGKGNSKGNSNGEGTHSRKI